MTPAPTPAAPALGPEELLRYARHFVLPEVGVEGQRRLKAGRVLCVGAGGLGSPALLYLAAAGVGTIGIVDHDRVDASNLQRQVIHGTPDLGRPKVESAADRLRAVNPNVALRPFEARLGRDNALELLRDFDVVVDGADNFTTRYLVNDACVMLGKPDVQGAVHRFEGQASVFAAKGGPCYRCLHPEPPPPGTVANCAEAGVLGVLPGLVGLIQAAEAVKLLLGAGDPLVGRLLLVDVLAMRFAEVKVARDPGCAVCGDGVTLTELPDDRTISCAPPTAPTEVKSMSVQADANADMEVEELKRRIDAGDAPALLDVREPWEIQICSLGGTAIPLGTLPGRTGELDPSREWVVYCQRGGRSAKAAALLRGAGFHRVRNLSGGILAWAERIDPRMPRY